VNERKLLIALPVQEPRGDRFLFASSDELKRELASRRSRWNGTDHPNGLELDATISCLTFFENVLRENAHSPAQKLIQNDNWNATYWSMIRLFESGHGFIVELNESEQFTVFNTAELLASTKHRIDDLKLTMLTGDCGKSYSHNGKILLEYVDRI
jgi:hypothetical protein